MAVRKIPTYQSQKQVGATFKPPVLQDGTRSILKGINDLAQNHLDKKAAEQGQEQGFTDLQSGATTIQQAETKLGTIRGDAYKKGARAAFVAKTKNNYETQLTQLYDENKYDIDSFNSKSQKLRNDILKTTPSNLQQLIVLDFDEAANRINNSIGSNIFNRQLAEDVKVQTDRITNIGVQLEQSILAKEGDPLFGQSEKLVAEQFSILNTLYNEQKIIDVATLGQYTQTIFDEILKAEITSAYEKLPIADREAFITSLSTPEGVQKYIDEAKATYGDEIKQALPQFEIPSTIDDSKVAGLVSDLNIMHKEMVKKFTRERETFMTSFENRVAEALEDGEDIRTAVPIASLAQAQQQYLLSDEEVQMLTDIYTEATLVESYVKNIDKMDHNDLETKIELIDLSLELMAEDTDPDSQIKISAMNKAKDLIQDQIETLETIINDKNPHAKAGSGTISLTDGPQSIDDLKTRQQDTADKVGVTDTKLIPLVDDSEIDWFKNNLNSNDINNRKGALQLLKQLEIDNNISIMTELDLSLEMEIALELPAGEQQDALLEAIITEGEIKATVEGLPTKKTGLGENEKVVDKLAMDNDFVSAHISKGHVEYAKVLGFYDKMINYYIANGVSYQEARKMTDNMYNQGFQPQALDNGQIITMPNSPIIDEKTKLNSLEQINFIMSNPILNNYVPNTNMTLSENESAFLQSVTAERQGTQYYFVNSVTDADLGANGGAMTGAGPLNENGKYVTHPIIVELDPNKQNAVKPSDTFAYGFDKTITGWTQSFNNDMILKDSVDDTRSQENTFVLDGTSLKEKMDTNKDGIVQKSEMKAYKEQKKTNSVDNKNKITAEWYASLALENSYASAGVDSVTVYDPDKEATVNGIMLKNAQEKATWTDWELEYLSQFEDYDLLDNEDARNYVKQEWNDIRSQGGFAGVGTGARLSPSLSLYIILRQWEENNG